jgi:hypothetical protein
VFNIKIFEITKFELLVSFGVHALLFCEVFVAFCSLENKIRVPDALLRELG